MPRFALFRPCFLGLAFLVGSLGVTVTAQTGASGAKDQAEATAASQGQADREVDPLKRPIGEKQKREKAFRRSVQEEKKKEEAKKKAEDRILHALPGPCRQCPGPADTSRDQAVPDAAA